MNTKYEYKKWLFYLGLLMFSLLSTLVFSTRAFADGSGTEADPYLVNNSADLKSYLALGNNSSTTLYIQLTGDITYTDSDRFTIYSNVVINGLKDNTAGSYYKMLKTGTSTTTSSAGFYLNASGYDVTFENMSFGDASYSYYQTYYGILLGGGNQVDLTVRNVDYYGRAGGQPFYNSNIQTTFTFDGNNNFNVQPGTNSQEFLEGVNVTFAEGSTTNISHNSSGSLSLFYNSTSSNQMAITIGANATVNIVTNKTYFTYDTNVNFTMGDSAKFTYLATASGFNFVSLSSYQSNYSIGNNATFSVSGAGKIESSNSATATFTVTNPAEISFENTSSSGLFNSSVTLSPTTQNDYLFDYTVGGQSTTKTASTSSTTLNDAAFATNLTKLRYYPYATASFDATGDVTNASGGLSATSVINVSNIAISNSYSLSNVEYKIFSTSPLADGADITTTESQDTITNSSDADYSDSITTDSFSIEQVPAGTYTIFLRATGSSSSGSITQTTQWVAETVTLEKSVLNVTVPSNMAFAVIDNAAFTSPNTYYVTNHTNYGITFGIDSITTEVSDITLVEDISTSDATNPLYLALKGESDGTTLPFVTSASTKPAFSISPFSDPYNFLLIGQYGGTVNTNGIRTLPYTLTYVIGSE